MSRNGRTQLPRIRTYRARKGLTQQELADLMGIDRTTLAWLESPHSRRRPGKRLAGVIAKTIGSTVGRVIDEYDQLRRAA